MARQPTSAGGGSSTPLSGWATGQLTTPSCGPQKSRRPTRWNRARALKAAGTRVDDRRILAPNATNACFARNKFPYSLYSLKFPYSLKAGQRAASGRPRPATTRRPPGNRPPLAHTRIGERRSCRVTDDGRALPRRQKQEGLSSTRPLHPCLGPHPPGPPGQQALQVRSPPPTTMCRSR